MGKIGQNDPCPCGSGRKFKKCHGATGAAPSAPVASGPTPTSQSNADLVRAVSIHGFSVSQDYQDTAQMRRFGPVILGAWRPAPDDEKRLRAAGVVVPPAVKGYFLIDTGGAFTAIDSGVARELNLQPVRREEAYGVGGSGMFDVVSASMLLDVDVGDLRGEKLAIELYNDFICAPGLREEYDAFNLASPDGTALRVIGLLGRDFLRFTTLTYAGLSGHWDMKIDPSVSRPWEGV